MRKTRHIYSPEEEEYIKKYYPDKPSSEISEALGLPVMSIYSKAKLMGVKKSKEYLNSEASGRFKGSHAGKKYRFPKGHTPHNKGKKMNRETYDKVSRTMFKKGHEPHNTKYDGYLSIRRDNRGVEYVFIRIAKAVHVPLHRHIWEKYNGLIPPGHNIVFKDGNRNNMDIKNLEMLSNAENLQKNYHDKYPPEIKKLIQLKGALSRQINKLKDQNK